MEYSYVLFDLDGTIINSSRGIIKSLLYALDKFDIHEENEEILRSFIGPSLKESFHHHYGFDQDKCDLAIKYYRENFVAYGILDNELYPGIRKLLNDLKTRGGKLAIATSKPTIFAKQILDALNISEFFEVIVGSNLDGSRFLKADVIQEVFNQMNITNKDKIVMIGDRFHDMSGANTIGIDCIGVTYGFGSFEELNKCNPKNIVNTVDKLNELLIDRNGYEFSVKEALAFYKEGKLNEWVYEFLMNEGDNHILGSELNEKKPYIVGPLFIPLKHLKRCMGPENHMEYIDDRVNWENHINWFVELIENGWDMPPLIAQYVNGEISVRDGNHRLGAVEKLELEGMYTIIWCNERSFKLTDIKENDYEK